MGTQCLTCRATCRLASLPPPFPWQHNTQQFIYGHGSYYINISLSSNHFLFLLSGTHIIRLFWCWLTKSSFNELQPTSYLLREGSRSKGLSKDMRVSYWKHRFFYVVFFAIFICLIYQRPELLNPMYFLRPFIKYGVLKNQFQFLTMPREGYVKFWYQQITTILFE